MIGDIELFGVIKVSDKVILTDPCYDDVSPFYNVVLDNVKGGEWLAEYAVKDFGAWGTRVTSLILSADMDGCYESTEFVGNCGVDSGTCGVFDFDAFMKLNEDEKVKSEWYDKNVVANCYDDSVSIEEGFFTPTGFGDGCYPAYVTRDEDGKIIGIEIVFVTEDEDD